MKLASPNAVLSALCARRPVGVSVPCPANSKFIATMLSIVIPILANLAEAFTEVPVVSAYHVASPPPLVRKVPPTP